MDRPRQAAPYRLQVSRPALHAYTISDGRHEPVQVGYALPVTRASGPGPGPDVDMDTADKPRMRPVRPGKFTPEPEEDIAAIAKQISDHAEAIYQTWKSRGLAPTEILNCHSSSSAADKLGSALMPQNSQAMEQLVNNFVVEDKARQAAARQTSPTIKQLVNNFVADDRARQGSPVAKTLPSSIQFALQKFENKSNVDGKTSPILSKQPTSPVNQPTRITPKTPSPASHQPVHHQEIFLETIETTFPEDLIPSKIQPISKTAPDTTDNVSVGLTTWPLKKKIIDKQRKVTKNTGTLPNRKDSEEYLDEVAREEERLINALKTGIILAEEPASVTAENDIKERRSLLLKDPKDKSPTPAKKEVVKPLNKEEIGFGTTVKPVLDYSKPTPRFIPKEDTVNGGPAVVRPVAKVPHPRARAPSNTSPNPVRPFLTRGSVAERVLIFEKCPTELLLDNKRRPPAGRKTGGDVYAKALTYSRDSNGIKPGQLPGTLQRQTRASRNHLIPRFYYPQGKPILAQHLDLVLKKVAAAFDNFPNQQVPRHQFGVIVKACDCPLYWKIPLFIACGGDAYVDASTFLEYWRSLCTSSHNPASRFMTILSRGKRSYLLPEDLVPLVQDVVETHPGLTFLKEATEFHSRYVHTVIARIYYSVNRSWSGRISLAELRRSNLLGVIKLLEEEDDINAITQYFSYEHFYVIYCKFWELDRDHDLYIDSQDLARHSEHALSSRMIERIFSGAVTRGGKHKRREDRMSYTEFVWFLLSEEDKTHPTSIEYWFRCMDLDGDGFLSMYELEYFYEEQLERMYTFGIETLPFEDCLCQMLDMIRPEVPGKISLCDLKRCKMTSIFFDTFFNLEKYLDHEQRDPFGSKRPQDNEGRELSDWDRYAAEEYELLVAEEGGQDHPDHDDDDMMYPPDEEDALSPNLDRLSWPSKPSFKVTDFDLDLEDSSPEESDDYAGDSDEEEEEEEGSI